VAEVIRVAVVDDHPVAFAGVQNAFADAGDIEVVGQAGSISEIEGLIERTSPDVLLCDVQLGNETALRVPSMLTAPAPPVVFFTAYDYPSFVRAALDGGAAGYVLKTEPLENLVSAIRVAASGGMAWQARRVRDARSAPRMPSKREMEVIALVCAGRSNAEVGGQLGIEERSVESHLRRLFDRYGTSSRTELAAYCVRNGWADMGGGEGSLS
jgi:DNA-binding NarL/FixJ family response regulator